MIISFPELTDLPTDPSLNDLFYLTSIGNPDLAGLFTVGSIYIASKVTTGQGTIGFTENSNTITGYGTEWENDSDIDEKLNVGDTISVAEGANSGNWVVSSITSDTEAILVGLASDKKAQIRMSATCTLSPNGLVLVHQTIGNDGNFARAGVISTTQDIAIDEGDVPGSDKNRITINLTGTGTSVDYHNISMYAKKNIKYDTRKFAAAKADFYKCDIVKIQTGNPIGPHTEFTFEKQDDSTYNKAESFLAALDIRGDDSGGNGGHRVLVEFGNAHGDVNTAPQPILTYVFKITHIADTECSMVINDDGEYYDLINGVDGTLLGNRTVTFTFWKDNNPETANTTPPYTVAQIITQTQIADAIDQSADPANAVFTMGQTAKASVPAANDADTITVSSANEIRTFNSTGSITFLDSTDAKQILRYSSYDDTTNEFLHVQGWTGSGTLLAETVIKQYSSDITFEPATADDITAVCLTQLNTTATAEVKTTSLIPFLGGESGASYKLTDWTETTGYKTTVTDGLLPSDTLMKTRYIGKDFHTHRAEAISFMKKRFPERFNDYVASDSGIMLVESMSYMMDTLAFYLDLQANETFFSTANLDSSINKLAKYLGYKPHGATSSSALLQMTNISPTTHDIKIPARSQFTATNGTIFETSDTELTITSSSTDFELSVTEGATTEATFLSNGIANQKFFIEGIPASSFLMTGVTATVNGVTWTEVENISLDSEALEFRVEYTDEPPFILFGDGLIGSIPDTGATIVVKYRTGKGTSGMVSSESIDAGPTLTNTNTDAVTYKVSNPTPSSGGTDGETIQSVKVNAPKVFNSAYRAVSQSDWDALAGAFAHETHGAISKARSVIMTEIVPGGAIDILFRDLTDLMNSTMQVIAEQAGFVSSDVNIGIVGSAGAGHLQFERYADTEYGLATNYEIRRPYSESSDYGINDVNCVIEMPSNDIMIYGTKFHGILMYNSNGDLVGALHKDNTTMTSNHITCMYLPEEDNWTQYWVGLKMANYSGAMTGETLQDSYNLFSAGKIYYGTQGTVLAGNGGMYCFQWNGSSTNNWDFEDYSAKFIERYMLDSGLGSEPNIKVNCVKVIPCAYSPVGQPATINTIGFWGTDKQGLWAYDNVTEDSRSYCAESSYWNSYYEWGEGADEPNYNIGRSVVGYLGSDQAQFDDVIPHVNGEFQINRILEIHYKFYSGGKQGSTYSQQGGTTGFPNQSLGKGTWSGIYILSHAGMIVCPDTLFVNAVLKGFYAAPFIHGLPNVAEVGNSFQPVGEHRFYGKSFFITTDGSIYCFTGNNHCFAHPCCADTKDWPLNMVVGAAPSQIPDEPDEGEGPWAGNWPGLAPYNITGGQDRFGVPVAMCFRSGAVPTWEGDEVEINCDESGNTFHWSTMSSSPTIDQVGSEPGNALYPTENGVCWDVPRIQQSYIQNESSGGTDIFRLMDIYLQATPYGALGLNVKDQRFWNSWDYFLWGSFAFGGAEGTDSGDEVEDSIMASAWLQYMHKYVWKWPHESPSRVYGKLSSSVWAGSADPGLDLDNYIYGMPSQAQGGLSFRRTFDIADMSEIVQKIDQIKAVFSTMIESGDTKGHVIVYALAVDKSGYYIDPSIPLMSALYDYLDSRKIITVTHEVQGGAQYLIKLRVSIKIKVNRAYVASNVTANVKVVVENMFKGREFGDNLYISQVYDVVNDVNGVDFAHIKILSTTHTDKINANYDVIIKEYEIITKDAPTGAIAVGALPGDSTTDTIGNDSNSSIVSGGNH